MTYEKWLSQTLRQLFRNVHLWILSAPILLFTWVGQLLGGATVVGLQSRMSRMMNNPEVFRDLMKANTPAEMLLALPSVYARIFGVRLSFVFLGLIVSLLAWLFTLILKGAVIHQAMPKEERPPWQESLHVGLNRAPHIFLIDFLLFLPMLFLIGGLIGAIFSLVGVQMARSGAQMGGSAAGLLFSLFCIAVPVILLYALFITFYRPLPYQACVQEHLSALEALKRGWQVFRRRLGPVLVLGVITMVVSFVLSMLGGLVISPVQMAVQFATGIWAVVGLAVWTVVGLIYALVAVAVMLFQLILYAVAWPDLAAEREGLEQPATR